jgi:uncharacterized protein (TIRG00374 family)
MVVLLVRAVDMDAVAAAIALANWVPIAAAVALYVLAMAIRAVLWHRLLDAAVSPKRLFEILIVGFAVSCLLPLRVGEIARAYLVARWCGIAYGRTLASMVAERILDGLSLSAVLLVALLFVPAPTYVLALGVAVAAIFGCLAVALGLACWRPDTVIALSLRVARVLPRRSHGSIERLVTAFASGLERLHNWRALPGLVALSVLGWLFQFAVFYLVLIAFGLPASVPVALLSGGVANLAALLPSAPAFVGTFDAALVKLLFDLEGVTIERATAYALVVHTILVVPIVLLGAVVMWRADLSLGDVIKRSLAIRPHKPAIKVTATAAASAAMAVNTLVPPI